MNFLPEASNFALPVDNIMQFLLIVSCLIVFLVFFLIIFFCIKYRASKKSVAGTGPTKNTTLEIALAAMILIFGVFTFFWSAKVFYHMRIVPKESLQVQVFAKQWMWIFHTENGGDQINILTVPLGKPVELSMISEDVIHSLFIPAFRVKQDVLPGRYTHLWFTADKLGEFPLFCSQYCGLDHSAMRAVVRVLPTEEYEKFINESRQENQISLDAGTLIFQKKSCSSCHNENSTLAPSLNNLAGSSVKLSDGSIAIADENYLRKSILNPSLQIVEGYQNLMPSFQGQLSEEELRGLILYIQSLSSEKRKESQ